MLDRLNELLAIPDPTELDATEQTVAVIQAALRTGTPRRPERGRGRVHRGH
jgi:hypothetical protein